MRDILDVIKNVESIYSTNSSLSTLKDFERLLDEMNMYVYKNWDEGELASGPKVDRHWVTCSFMWPREKMPDPMAAKRLIDYGCRVKYEKTRLLEPRKVKSPDDFRPGTRKGKIDSQEIWLVRITMPKKLMADINRGYRNLDVNKVDDILTMNGGVNAQVEPVEEQGAADAQPAA